MLNQLIQIISNLLLPLGQVSNFTDANFHVPTNTLTLNFDLHFNLKHVDPALSDLLLFNDIETCHIHLTQDFAHEPTVSILLLPLEVNDPSIVIEVNDALCPVALYLKSLIAYLLSDLSTWQPTLSIGKGGTLYDHN